MFSFISRAQSQSQYVSYTDTIKVNGQSLFYAVEGQGKPVLLIHGNGGSHNDLETTMRQLAQKGYRVYACDSRGQGANAPLQEYHYKDMAEDMHQFMKKKGIKKPAVFGWSDGGIVALMTEVMYPGTFSLIVTSGANITVDQAFEDAVYTDIFGNNDNPSPLVRMMQQEPNMTAQDMQSIQCPAMICAGDHDLILEGHTRWICDNIPQGELNILKGADHGSHIWHNLRIGKEILRFFKKHGY